MREAEITMTAFCRRFVLAILMVAASTGPAWSVADDGWKKIGESDGIAGFTRPTAKSSVDEIRAVGIVNAPVAVVEAVIRDISIMPQYMFLCKEAALINTPEMKSAGDAVYFHSVTDMPFPVSDRDAVVKSVWSVDRKTGAVYCRAKGLKTTFRQNKDIVRMPLLIIECTLAPKGEDKTEVIYQVLGDPGGELPSWLVNMLTSDYGIKTIAGLRKMVSREKFRNAQKVITVTPHDQK